MTDAGKLNIIALYRSVIASEQEEGQAKKTSPELHGKLSRLDADASDLAWDIKQRSK